MALYDKSFRITHIVSQTDVARWDLPSPPPPLSPCCHVLVSKFALMSFLSVCASPVAP